MSGMSLRKFHSYFRGVELPRSLPPACQGNAHLLPSSIRSFNDRSLI